MLRTITEAVACKLSCGIMYLINFWTGPLYSRFCLSVTKIHVWGELRSGCTIQGKYLKHCSEGEETTQQCRAEHGHEA